MDACNGVTPVVQDVGPMNVICEWCGSRSWLLENINCCALGEILLPAFPDPPPEVSDGILQPNVRQNIRAYNMSIFMASVGHQNLSTPVGVFVVDSSQSPRVAAVPQNAGSRRGRQTTAAGSIR